MNSVTPKFFAAMCKIAEEEKWIEEQVITIMNNLFCSTPTLQNQDWENSKHKTARSKTVFLEL